MFSKAYRKYPHTNSYNFAMTAISQYHMAHNLSLGRLCMDRLLEQSSYNPRKATTIRTLTRHAQLVCDSPDSLADEIKYLDNVFSKNNYSRTLLDTTLTETLNRTLRTLTRHLSLLQPYLTSKGLLKLSHGS